MKKKIEKGFLIFFISLFLLGTGEVKASSIDSIDRISGKDRFATAIEVSKKTYENSDNAIIANGEDFPDALSATSLASYLNAPILLVEKNSISNGVLAELSRLDVKKVFIIGGKSSVSNEVLDKIDYYKERIAGKDRYETNNLVISKIEETKGASNSYIVTTGQKYPDSVIAVGISIKKEAPIKLVNKNIEDKYNLSSNYIVGGTSSVDILDLKGERIQGKNRYITSLELAKISHPETNTIIISSGENYADALTAVSLCNKNNAPIILSENNSMDKNIMEYINKKGFNNIIIVGGAVKNSVIDELKLFLEVGNLDNFFKPVAIPQDVKEGMAGVSMPENAKISFDNLAYIPLLHYDFNGNIKEGEIIVNKKVGTEVGSIFKELYNIKYPIEKIKLIDKYGADDNKSMADNNSSGFNYRLISGTNKLSKHAEGLAVDINPLYNPYTKNGVAIPKESQPFVNRKLNLDWMIYKNDSIYKIFAKYGWTWGGNWKNPDYQHFEK